MKKCIYCKQEKEDNEFSLEHIIPEFMGGKRLNKNIFRTRDVCAKCNNDIGLFVDHAYKQNFLTYKDSFQNNELIFHPLGNINTLTNSEEVCEFYICELGYVYAFHKVASEFETHLGGCPLRNNTRIAILVLNDNANKNDKKLTSLLLAFRDQFKKYSRYSLNLKTKDDTSIIQPEDDSILPYFDKVRSVLGSPISTSFPFNSKEMKRIYFKIAIGLGYNLLGSEFIDSEYADELHKGLWNKENKARGSDFLIDIPNNDLDAIFSFSFPNYIGIIWTGDMLSYRLKYGTHTINMLICPDIRRYGYEPSQTIKGEFHLWDNKNYKGPIDIIDIVQHITEIKRNSDMEGNLLFNSNKTNVTPS